MSFASYMKANAGEYVLVLCAAWSVATVGLDAFFLFSISDAIGYAGRALLVLVIEALLLLVLYWAVSAKGRKPIGAEIYIAISVVLVVACIMASSGESVYEDVEGNYLYFAVVVLLAALGCFVLTRTLAGCAVWFVAAALICSVVQAFYESEELVLSVVATFAALALIVHRNFRLGLAHADIARMPSHAGVFASAAVPTAAVVGVALAASVAFIALANPGVLDIKLITDYRSLPIEELIGTAAEHPTLNLEMTSENILAGEPYTTDDLLEDADSTTVFDAESVLEQGESEQSDGGGQAGTSDDTGGSRAGGGTQQALDSESLEPEYDVVSYSTVFPWIVVYIVLAVLIVAAIVGYFVGRRIYRRKRLERMLALPTPTLRIKAIYRFLLTRLEVLGITQPVGMTLSEWAVTSRRSLDVLDEVTGVTFAELTAIYVAADYDVAADMGTHEPTEDDVVLFAAYYLGFWKAAREHLGNFKYFFTSFRL